MKHVLGDLARWLVDRFPWPLRDAAWFVLTDEPPSVEPLRMKYNRSSGTYELTFAPWVSESTIRRAYRSVHETDNRPLGRKSLSVFAFVNEHTEVGQTPKWAALTQRWNEENRDSENEYEDRSGLRRAYTRVEKRIAASWMDEHLDAPPFG